MHESSKPSLLQRLMHRRTEVRAQEPADMGTAFGMECWLDEVEARGIDPGVPAPAGSAREWLQRLFSPAGGR